MQRVVQTMRQIARHEVEQHWNASLGVVKALHGANGESHYACTVELRETRLVLPKVPIATGLIGLAGLPRENDLVIVIFVGGNPHAPVVLGRLYSEDVAPPKNSPGEFVAVLPGDEESEEKRLELRIETPGDGTRDIRLKLAGSVEVAVSIGNEGLEFKAGDTSLKLSQSSGSDGKTELTAGGCKVVLEQGGDVTIEASGTLKLKAAKIEISGDTSVKVAGQTIDLN
jgi:phage baseplate assembly protein gpV